MKYLEDEQELTSSEDVLSAAADAFSIESAARDVLLDQCIAINAGHVAYSIGNYRLGYQKVARVYLRECQALFDTWHTYARPLVSIYCEDVIVDRFYSTGQSIQNQFSGEITLKNSLFENMREGIRATTSSRAFSVNSYWFDSGAGIADEYRYIAVTPDVVKIINNTFSGLFTVGQSRLESGAVSDPGTGTPPTWGTVVIANNIFDGPVSGAGQYALAVQKTNSAAYVADISEPTVVNNIYYDTTTGVSKVLYAPTWGSSTTYTIDGGCPGLTGNSEADPGLSASSKIAPTSVAFQFGTHYGYTRDFAGVQRPNPPSAGAYDIPVIRDYSRQSRVLLEGGDDVLLEDGSFLLKG